MTLANENSPCSKPKTAPRSFTVTAPVVRVVTEVACICDEIDITVDTAVANQRFSFKFSRDQETIPPKHITETIRPDIPNIANRSERLFTNDINGAIPTLANIATLRDDALMNSPN